MKFLQKKSFAPKKFFIGSFPAKYIWKLQFHNARTKFLRLGILHAFAWSETSQRLELETDT